MRLELSWSHPPSLTLWTTWPGDQESKQHRWRGWQSVFDINDPTLPAPSYQLEVWGKLNLIHGPAKNNQQMLRYPSTAVRDAFPSIWYLVVNVVILCRYDCQHQHYSTLSTLSKIHWYCPLVRVIQSMITVLSRDTLQLLGQSFAWNKESLESWQMVEPWNSVLGSNFQTWEMHLE